MSDKRLKPNSSRALAVQNGLVTYQGAPCKKGHSGLRYTKGATCIDCIKHSRDISLNPRQRSDKNNELSLKALSAGKTTYIPNKPCKEGHLLRFVNSNNCVECDKLMREKHKITQKYNRIAKEYRLAKSQYLNLVSAQNSSCKLCNKKEIDHFKLHVDHCHETKIVRGLLCGKCNQGIGLLNHDPNLIQKAALYCK